MKEEKEGEGARNEGSGKGLIYIETAKRYGTTCVSRKWSPITKRWITRRGEIACKNWSISSLSSPDLFDALSSEITKLNPYHLEFFPTKKVKADLDGVRGAGQTQNFDEMSADINALSRNASPNVEISDKSGPFVRPLYDRNKIALEIFTPSITCVAAKIYSLHHCQIFVSCLPNYCA